MPKCAAIMPGGEEQRFVIVSPRHCVCRGARSFRIPVFFKCFRQWDCRTQSEEVWVLEVRAADRYFPCVIFTRSARVPRQTVASHGVGFHAVVEDIGRISRRTVNPSTFEWKRQKKPDPAPPIIENPVCRKEYGLGAHRKYFVKLRPRAFPP